MSLKVVKVGEVVENEIILFGNKAIKDKFCKLLTNADPIEDYTPAAINWRFEITIGKGPAARSIMLDLPPLISKQGYERSKQSPVCIVEGKVIYFRNTLFLPERLHKNNEEFDEILLRAKKIVYEEEAEKIGLREQVANIEAAINYQKTGVRRDPIPEDVKLLVWSRDGGACMRCGSNKNLHFDHIIPVSKGGGNCVENIQILCQNCNLKKSDKIAV